MASLKHKLIKKKDLPIKEKDLLDSYISIANGKEVGFEGEDKIYIGGISRKYQLEASPLANPYVVGDDKDGDRETVKGLYKRWLWNHLKEDGSVKQTLFLIARLVKAKRDAHAADPSADIPNPVQLVTWGYNYGVHGEVVMTCVKWLINTEQV